MHHTEPDNLPHLTTTTTLTGGVQEVIVGGALYTWGGDFSWVEPCDARGPGPAKRDHHKGCLGHGDTEGRLVPTPVAGELQVRVGGCGSVGRDVLGTCFVIMCVGVGDGCVVEWVMGALQLWCGLASVHHALPLLHSPPPACLLPLVGNAAPSCSVLRHPTRWQPCHGLQGFEVRQVACGLHFTVAVTVDGRVLQMGATGAGQASEKHHPWEGARVPIQVREPGGGEEDCVG
jgi:hypothetical protein